MTTTRRGFLAAILAAGAAPAIVQAGSIMRIAPPKGYVVTGDLLMQGSITVGVDLAPGDSQAYVSQIWKSAGVGLSMGTEPPRIIGPIVVATWFDCGTAFRVLRPDGAVDMWDGLGRFRESLPASPLSRKLSLQMLQDEAHSRHFAGTLRRESRPVARRG